MPCEAGVTSYATGQLWSWDKNLKDVVKAPALGATLPCSIPGPLTGQKGAHIPASDRFQWQWCPFMFPLALPALLKMISPLLMAVVPSGALPVNDTFICPLELELSWTIHL